MATKGKLLCSRKELQLLGTLNGGQSFRWKCSEENGTQKWTGVFANKLWILLQKDNHIEYEVFEPSAQEPSKKKKLKKDMQYDDLLKQYFRLDHNLADLYQTWSKNDQYFKLAAEQFYGIRILNQDPIENIFSFICSSNNHISRITSMVEKLGTFYGEDICKIEDKTHYSFPNVEKLADPKVEQNLRDNGFGYRAKYIHKTAEIIVANGGLKWIEKLKKMNYEDAKKELMTLNGVGAKVADCICLMSLGHLGAIPVDTHIYQIAAKFYLPNLPKKKTVNDKVYKEIGDHFRGLYGPLAGWAHTVLFCFDLKKFQKQNAT